MLEGFNYIENSLEDSLPHYAWSITLATCLVLLFNHHSSATFLPSYMFLSAFISTIVAIAPYRLNLYRRCNRSFLPIKILLLPIVRLNKYPLCKYRRCNHYPYPPLQVSSLQLLLTASSSTTAEITHLLPLQGAPLKSLLTRLYKYCRWNHSLTSFESTIIEIGPYLPLSIVVAIAHLPPLQVSLLKSLLNVFASIVVALTPHRNICYFSPSCIWYNHSFLLHVVK